MILRPASIFLSFVALLATFNASASQSHAWSVQGSSSCTELPCFNSGELAGAYACSSYYGSSLKAVSSYYNLTGDTYYYVCQSGAGSISKKINTPCPSGHSWNDVTQRCDAPVDCSGKNGQTIETRYGATITDLQAQGDLSDIDIGSQSTLSVDGCEAVFDSIPYCGLYKTTILGESYFYCDYVHKYTGQASGGQPLPPSEGDGLTLTDQITFEPPTVSTTSPPVVTPGPPSITEQNTVTTDPSTESATVTSENGSSYTLVINRGGNKTTYVTTTTVVQSNGTTSTTSRTNVVYTSNQTTTVFVNGGTGTTTTTSSSPVTVSGGGGTTTTTTTPDGGTSTTTSEDPPSPDAPCSGSECDEELSSWGGPGTELLDGMQSYADSFGSIASDAASLGLELPGLSLSLHTGQCQGFPYDLGKFGSGTFDAHCDMFDNYIRPGLEWFFYILTAATCFGLGRDSYQRVSSS